MSTPDPSSETPRTNAPEPSGVRRRLLRGGLSSAPLLVTLASRPVLAQTCFSPSETLSGTMSHKAGDLPVCNGRSPGMWKTLGQGKSNPKLPGGGAGQWPIPANTPFHSVFRRGNFANFVKVQRNGTTTDLTMLEVMELRRGQDPSKIGFHFIGAYLNILTGLIDPRAMTAARLSTLWSEWVTKGYYTPYAGARPWYAEDIVAYLVRTGIASD
ncbi:hypothetical protein E6C76_10195 [Pseudothauera nasutitermitis]|uniref:Uncharacterized protein n=1 Tax=Pseudothauera nasutitermitis TaxID=2565930 RepID=A0A4S4B088_9RHOO|nr:hypothetical protein [Pseudothauera nasutitermitis]THF65898.1 hypothetical protein E6C76_10195 [Pseudothauera nasutitermitis]